MGAFVRYPETHDFRMDFIDKLDSNIFCIKYNSEEQQGTGQ